MTLAYIRPGCAIGGRFAVVTPTGSVCKYLEAIVSASMPSTDILARVTVISALKRYTHANEYSKLTLREQCHPLSYILDRVELCEIKFLNQKPTLFLFILP